MAVTLGSSGVTFSDSTAITTATVDAGALINITAFKASGTWYKPGGCTRVKVQMVGGGGGGAGYCESGGAGCYAEGYYDVSAVSSVSVTIGGGGGAVGYYAAAGNGGTTSFGAYLSASGGYGANQNYSHSGGHGGNSPSGHNHAVQGGPGCGHVNSVGSWSGGMGGRSFFGGSAGQIRNHTNLGSFYGKVHIGAPGTGGPGGMTDGSGLQIGGQGEDGMVVVYAYK